MKRNPLNNRPPLIAALLMGAVMALLGARGRQVCLEQARPLGRLSAQQVLSLSEPICQAVVPHSDPLILNADASHGLHDSWNVVCSDTAGHDLLVLTWNADTGELCEMGACGWQRQRHSGPLLNSARAIMLGRFWLRSLRVSPAHVEWRLLGSPVCMAKHHWTLQYAVEGRQASVELEAHTGALESARFSLVLQATVAILRKHADQPHQPVVVRGVDR